MPKPTLGRFYAGVRRLWACLRQLPAARIRPDIEGLSALREEFDPFVVCANRAIASCSGKQQDEGQREDQNENKCASPSRSGFTQACWLLSRERGPYHSYGANLATAAAATCEIVRPAQADVSDLDLPLWPP